ncbi:hypothetical protein LX32DRAFT_295115 [Colletotrichum zoysiae]|uniref:Uncharacterized protein n=1 Tax=Colletotrichum zoysiae TaxID=1216348 RepID=A0AAD9LTK7_9PEZI|nr:hypothetical protein LX32DRAFT_295115 [Colletotrichum zoysiae]
MRPGEQAVALGSVSCWPAHGPRCPPHSKNRGPEFWLSIHRRPTSRLYLSIRSLLAILASSLLSCTTSSACACVSYSPARPPDQSQLAVLSCLFLIIPEPPGFLTLPHARRLYSHSAFFFSFFFSCLLVRCQHNQLRPNRLHQHNACCFATIAADESSPTVPFTDLPNRRFRTPAVYTGLD